MDRLAQNDWEASGLRQRRVRSATLAKRVQSSARGLRRRQPQQSGPAIAKHLPLLGQGDALAHRPPGPEIGAEFVRRGAEPCGGLEAPEPAQGQLSTCPSGYLPRSRELRSGSEWHPWQVLVVIAHTSRCLFNGDKLGRQDGVPFSVTVAL